MELANISKEEQMTVGQSVEQQPCQPEGRGDRAWGLLTGKTN